MQKKRKRKQKLKAFEEYIPELTKELFRFVKDQPISEQEDLVQEGLMKAFIRYTEIIESNEYIKNNEYIENPLSYFFICGKNKILNYIKSQKKFNNQETNFKFEKIEAKKEFSALEEEDLFIHMNKIKIKKS